MHAHRLPTVIVQVTGTDTTAADTATSEALEQWDERAAAILSQMDVADREIILKVVRGQVTMMMTHMITQPPSRPHEVSEMRASLKIPCAHIDFIIQICCDS